MTRRMLLGKGFQIFVAVLLLIPFLWMSAGPAHGAMTQKAVVATAAADYSSGDHVVISVDPLGGPRAVSGTDQSGMYPTISDITVAAYGRYFYRIERFQSDSITKFDISSPATPVWQFSTLDPGETSSNPHDLVFANPTKAYLMRYGTAKAWIVDPSAAAEADFKIGELDLSAYADGDGYPEMHTGVVVNGKLFIALQRIDRDNAWTPTTAYLAVFDTETDTEIDTGQGQGGLQGIELPVKNPGGIQYLEENNTIYVQGKGDLGATWTGRPAEYSGGIISVNPDTYQTSLVLDDGNSTNHPYGNISGMTIADSTKGYFAGYAGWGDNTLYVFNPATGQASGAANDYLKNKNIAGMETGVYLDMNEMLWVCNSTDAEVVILDTTDDSIDEKISTNLNPQRVVFAQTEVIASFQASSTSGEPPLTVNFDASSSSGIIDSYAWDFGDGTTGSGSTVSHEYASEGTFTAALTVTDDFGTTDTATATITVEEEDEDDELFGCFISTSAPKAQEGSLPLIVVSLILGLCLIASIALLRSKRR